MNTIKIENFGTIISTKESGKSILDLILSKLNNENKIKIDFLNVKSMATFCAKQIFGFLYVKLGSEKFFEKLEFNNTSEDLKTIIKIGIQSAIEEEQ